MIYTSDITSARCFSENMLLFFDLNCEYSTNYIINVILILPKDIKQVVLTMEKICILLITMSSLGVFAMPFSESDLEFIRETQTKSLERIIAELDEQIDSWSSNDATSLETFNTFLDLRFKIKKIYRDQKDLSTHMAAYETDVSIGFFFVGLIVFLYYLINELMSGLFSEEKRPITIKIAIAVKPVVPIIALYWLVIGIYRIHFPSFYQM